MALIKSTILAQISGSINGTTFSHNRGGAYARNRSMVSNPQTTRQSEVRTALSTLSSMWRDSLTPAQRDAWNAYGSSVNVINRVGDTITLSGIASFNRINLFRVATLDLAPDLDPPPASSLPPGTVIPSFVSAAMINDPAPGVAITTNATPATHFGFATYYGAPVSPGIRYFRGPYAGRVLTPGGAPTTTLVSLEDLVPDAAGYYIPFRITLYDTTSSLPIWTVHQAPLETEAPA